MGLTVLTGASGAGKTTICRAFHERYPKLAEIHFFDSIGVPSATRMIADYGSGEDWQRIKTIEWLEHLAGRLLLHPKILLEGQMRISFIREGQRHARLDDLQIVLLDCDDQTRARRLTQDRSQAELANPDMMNWARFLRREAEQQGARILDTSQLSLDEAVEWIRACVDKPYPQTR